jgi:lipoate-protein ligase A
VRLDIQNNRIAAARIFGDFMGQGEMSELTDRLVDVAYDRDAIAQVLATIDTTHYIANVTKDELLSLIAP